MILTSIVLWVHIFGAIGWLGSAMVFGMVIGPSLPKLTPASRLEFLVKVMSKYGRYVEIFSIVTVVFGVLTVVVLANGDYSIMDASTAFGLYISIGALIALFTMGLAFAVVLPALHKVVRLSEALMKAPGPPPPELMVASKRLRIGSTIAMILLIIVTVFMVAGATL